MQDLRLALRSLRATPIVTTVAVLSLALGIGANIALFSLANSLLLRPLPVENPSELVMISHTGAATTRFWELSIWRDLRQRGIFKEICAWSPTTITHTDGNDARAITGALVSGSYFQVLGVRAAIGRMLTEDDDRPGGGADGPVMVISDAFWQRRFQRDPAAIGSRLDLNGVPISIVGVAVPGFSGTDVGTAFDAWLPLVDEPILNGADSLAPNVVLLARLRTGQTRETTTAALRALQTDLRESTGIGARGRLSSEPYYQNYLTEPFVVVSAALGTSLLRDRVGSPLIALIGAAGLVLLVACANIANVLLARASARRHELSLRGALGASRWRLIRQLLVESVLLAVLASAAGVLVASWASALLVQQLSTQTVPISLDLAVDWRLVAFSTTVATIAVLLFGVTPAVRATTVAPLDVLREQSRGGALPSEWTTDVLVLAQIALSLVLLVGAGLFVRTFVLLASRDPGFAHDRLLVARIDSRRAIGDPLQRVSAYERVRQAVRAVPGVSELSLSLVTPVGNFGFNPPIDVSGGRTLEAQERFVSSNVISTGWFTTYRVPILIGRDFTDGDRLGTEPVAIVNQAFGRKFLDGQSPLGHFITLPDVLVQPSPNVPIRIVGVAADAVYAALREPPQPTMYLALAQHDEPFLIRALGTINLTIRVERGAPALLGRSIGMVIAGIDPRFTVTFRPLDEQLDDSLARERVLATLAGFFGALAMLLAGLGLYGVTTYAVARRRTEIGIRMALGASPGRLVQIVVSRLAMLVGAGVIVGAGISLWLGRSIAVLLYGLEPYDPTTLVFSAATLAAVGALASWLPAWRAARLDPAEVLRET